MRPAMPLWRRRVQHRYNVLNAHFLQLPRPHTQYQTLPSSNDARPDVGLLVTKTRCGGRRRRELKRSLTAYSQPLSARRQLPADLG
jgi:hypothetical protein